MTLILITISLSDSHVSEGDVIFDATQVPGNSGIFDTSMNHGHHPSPVSQSNLSTIIKKSPNGPKSNRTVASPAPSGSNNKSKAVNNKSGQDDEEPSASATAGSKRRRFTSSPVRPWKSPSPSPGLSAEHPHNAYPNHHHAIDSDGQESPSPSATSASLFRHISVIREAPMPILKPQVVSYPHVHSGAVGHHHHPQITPAHHHQLAHHQLNPAHHHHHHHHHPAYHPLVDPYLVDAAAYHLYKNGTPTAATGHMSGSSPPSASQSAAAAAAGAQNPWGSYN